MLDLIDPKRLELDNDRGEAKVFVLSKWPAVAGRELVAKYPVANMPKLGDYGVSEAVMYKNMGFVGVEVADGNVVRLTTEAIIQNHCGGWETLARLEWAMVEYNCSFFANGVSFDSFGTLVEKLRPLVSQILTDSSVPSSGLDPQPSTS